MKKVFLILFIVSVFGAITTIFSVATSALADGDTQNGITIDVHRNGNFFSSDSKLFNSVLVFPRYFMKVKERERNNGEFSVEGYATLNMIIGFLSLILLVLTIFSYKKGLLGKVFSIAYTSYWAIVTIFMYVQFFSGVYLFTTNTWG